MCTLSAVVDAGRLRVVMNRDEQRTRAAAIPPRVTAVSDRRAAYPVDPISRGTWIAMNDAGIVFALLNRSSSHVMKADAPSRGTIIPKLLAANDLLHATTLAKAIRPETYAPFTLIVCDVRSVTLVRTDGDSLELSAHNFETDGPFVRTSSGLGDALVERPRSDLFFEMVVPGKKCFAMQDAFHAHRWPGRGEISVLMDRPDARTVSRTIIEIDQASATLRYMSEDDDAEPTNVVIARVKR